LADTYIPIAKGSGKSIHDYQSHAWRPFTNQGHFIRKAVFYIILIRPELEQLNAAVESKHNRDGCVSNRDTVM
jgi:hypothetical protein